MFGPISPFRFPPWRALVEAVIAATIGLLAIDRLMLEGLICPVVVSSGSMAPTLLGPHRLVTCSQCGRVFACGEESIPEDHLARCLNCGFRDNDVTTAPRREGERLLIDKTAYWHSAPARWDLVVFCNPENPHELLVKRVVGTPGETIAILDGEVVVNGRVAAKNWQRAREMALVVHDSYFQSPSNPSPWRTDSASSGWRWQGNGFVYTSDVTGAPRSGKVNFDWLSFHPATARSGSAGGMPDDIPYNQDESRVLNDVHDLGLRCRLRSNATGEMALRVPSRNDLFEMHFSGSTHGTTLMQNGRAIAHGLANPFKPGEFHTVELRVFDSQVAAGVDGSCLLLESYQPAAVDGSPGFSGAISVGMADGGAAIERLEVLRDVYYGGADRDPPYSRSIRLGPEEYFVLGDNSPLSNDSRHWKKGEALLANLLVGKALPLKWLKRRQ